MKSKYHIKQLKKFNNLEISLREASQIEPIIVFVDNQELEYIVDGLKRFEILNKLNEEISKRSFKNLIKLFGFILDSKDIYESTIWKYFHLLKENNISEEEIFSQVIKNRLKLSIRDIWKVLEIKYSTQIEDLLTELNMGIKELTAYYQLESKDINSLFLLFTDINANKNNRKDIFSLINEIMKREKISFGELLKKEELDNILNSELQKNDKINIFKKALFNMRYPNMSKEIELLTNLKNKIKTPGLKLDLPIDKESVRSNISFQFRNYKELEKKINSLQKLLNDGNLKEILIQIENR